MINTADINIDTNFAQSNYLGGRDGVSPSSFFSMQDRIKVTAEDMIQLILSGKIGFLSIIEGHSIFKEIRSLAGKYPSGKYNDIILLGIGGSALGARAIKNAFEYTGKKGINIHVLDNIDPAVFYGTLNKINLKKTLFIVISKSGATVETMAQLFIVMDKFKKAAGAKFFTAHFICITTDGRGPLFNIAQKYHVPMLFIPENVGGRYSVLSPVGMLPAALMGINISDMIDGAKSVKAAFIKARGLNIGELAGIYYLMHKELNKNIMVFMPYTSRLTDFGEWLAQLWAESLGKRYARDGREVFSGATPVIAVGARDQHSQLQLYKEGPPDKFITFIEIEKPNIKEQKIIPVSPVDIEFRHLFSKTLGMLINAEMNATRTSLVKSLRPSIKISIPELSAKTLGELFVFFEILIVFIGLLYQINPFDQPGVEEGKQILKQIL
ncbi:MAG: glucose-6-phosphate isomerase [Deltaproteobacteria bacterium]|nr:glucose-6-phosphate isomerase [Deltaproteobacteria bacterium]